MAKQTKKMVSERAVLARLNRKLAKEQQKVCTTKEDSRGFGETGRYYVVDLNRNTIVIKGLHYDGLERLAKEEGCLKEYEALEQ